MKYLFIYYEEREYQKIVTLPDDDAADVYATEIRNGSDDLHESWKCEIVSRGCDWQLSDDQRAELVEPGPQLSAFFRLIWGEYFDALANATRTRLPVDVPDKPTYATAYERLLEWPAEEIGIDLETDDPDERLKERLVEKMETLMNYVIHEDELPHN